MTGSASKLPDAFRIVAQPPEAAPVLANLFEHYLHDMAEWFGFDTGENGAYAYPAEKCWDDEGVVYFPYAGDVPIGFAIVAKADPALAAGSLDLEEFFVIRRYRRAGVGVALARHVWDCHPSPWLVRVYRGNRPAMPFWRRCVSEYTGGRFMELQRRRNGKLWSHFTFRSDAA